jgi:glycosyltransferase involved in cell wall biosynthesis
MQPEFALVVPSYNNETFCFDNLQSIAKQEYPYWHLYYIDDASTDGTHELVKLLVDKFDIASKTTIIRNDTHKCSLENHYQVISKLDPKKIVVSIDGDDFLAHTHVLNSLAEVYKDPNIWLTHGNYQTSLEPPIHGEKMPDHVVKEGSFRAYKYLANHVKTFYAKLFQKIKKEDLLWKDGTFFQVCGDMAMMFPMIEMARNGHFKFIEEILYIYNISNPLNDHKIKVNLLFDLGEYIRKMPRYKPLKKLF